jgi:ubiquinone/menaquinone biosynthesis C-methylase UbiE
VSSSRRDVGRFDDWASTYDRSYLQRLVFEPVQKTLLEMAAAGKPGAASILDVGCGTGRLLRAASGVFPGARLAGVDAAPAMVERARAEGGGIEFQQAFAENLPFGDGEFDLVFSTMTFHHWADQRRGMAEISRVMKPEGFWLLADFTPHGLLKWVAPRRFPRLERLRDELGEVGLGVGERRSVAGLGGQVSILKINRN